MSSNCRNQQQKETEKKTFLADGNQISNDWKRKKPLFLQMAIKSGKIGDEKKYFCNWRQSNQQWLETGKKTFVPDLNQISNEWKRKKKLLCVKAIKSGKNGNGKKTFLRHASQIRKDWKQKKLKMKPRVHRCQTKCGYACSKCPLYKASRGEFLRILIFA